MEPQRKIEFLPKNAFSSKNLKAIYFFIKTALQRTMQFSTENSYFTIGNVHLIQTVGIPMGTDPAPFCANLYLCNYKSKYKTSKEKFKIQSFFSN